MVFEAYRGVGRERAREGRREEVGFPSTVFFYFGEGKTRSCLKQFVR